MSGLLAENFDDVLESVLSSLEETLSKDDSAEKLKRIEKNIASLEKKRKKLTDMYIDDKLPSLTLFRLKIAANADSYCVCGFYIFFVKSVMFCVILIILWNA